MNSEPGQPPPTYDVQHNEQQEGNGSSDDEDSYEKLVNLQQVKRFLIESQAFNTFTQRFRLLVEPKDEEEASVIGPTATEAALITETRPGVFAAFFMTSVEASHYLSNFIRDGPSSGVRDVTFTLLDTWHRMQTAFQRQFRPAVPPGYRRLEWTCGCGMSLYGDFDNSDPQQVDQLQRELLEEVNYAPQEQDGDQHTENSSRATANAPLYGSSSSPRAPARNLPGSNTFLSSSVGAQTGPYIPQSTYNHSPFLSHIRKYFAICVNAGENLTIVGEIEVSSITRDGNFFKKMWKEYDNIRGFRSSYFRHLLVKPVDVKFVKFTVEHHQRADICAEPPDFPDKREVEERRYEYTPCPLTTRPTAGTFLHYRKCKRCSPTTKWLPRVPKKLSPALLEAYRNAEPTDDVIGWGIHIIEGPNKKAMTWLCLLVLVFSGIVSLLYTSIKHDVAPGIAIGTFMITAMTLMITAFYFQWKEE